jgi:crotonobetainyl-CoA:carnitine CoA-transferase CaiB-like acyl-CoA transferase
MRVGFPVVDTLTGQTAALAILAALLRREQTGEGESIDVAMFDASLAFMTSAVVPYLVTGQLPQQTGNVGYSGQPTAGVFAAADGRLISLGVVQQAQFEALARDVEHIEWLQDARYATPDLRRQHGAALQAELGAVFRTKNATDWEARLSAAGIPCGVVRNVGEAVSLEGMDARGVTVPVRIAGLPDRQDVAVVGAGFVSSQGTATVDSAPPRHGEHSDEVLAWLGYGAAEREAILAGNRSTSR